MLSTFFGSSNLVSQRLTSTRTESKTPPNVSFLEHYGERDPAWNDELPLASFKKKAERSRYGLLTKIENNLALGRPGLAAKLLDAYAAEELTNTEIDDATGVRMADGVEVNHIVNNYRRFYEVCIHYAEHTTTNADSVDIEAIAQLCPTKDGAVVYKARALYNVLYDTVRIFESGCDTAVADTMSPSIGQGPEKPHSEWNLASMNKDGQQYLLYPNPNDGNFIIEQAVVDDKPVSIEILDAVGRSVYIEQVQFAGAKARLQIGKVAPGMYMLLLMDNKYRKYRFKFVVE